VAGEEGFEPYLTPFILFSKNQAIKKRLNNLKALGFF